MYSYMHVQEWAVVRYSCVCVLASVFRGVRFGVLVCGFVGKAKGCQGFSEGVADGGLTAADWADSHETVTHKRSFVQLDDLD